MNRVACLVASGFLSLTVGCGGSGGPSQEITTVCDRPESQICIEYLNTTAALKMSLESACLGDNGVVGTSCPAGAVGTCTLAIGANDAASRNYFYGGTASQLEAACVSSQGAWAPAP